MQRLTLVIVTFKRQQLLRKLFESIVALNRVVWRIVLVDNENSGETEQISKEYETRMIDKWGAADVDNTGASKYIVYCPQHKNTGGSGGFSAGSAKAYEIGAQWFWLMDDDVAVEPDAIEKLEKWTSRFKVVQGRRYNFDGTPFYWQYNFLVRLGIPNPIAPGDFNEDGYRVMNTACFEGGLFAREIVEQIGLPDYRFFIYWDDTVYGYLASKVATAVVVEDFVMRRTREIQNWDIAGKRKLNSTSDMNRYYIMRNRGYMMRYFKEHGDFNSLSFGFGTFLTFCKEFIRIIVVDHGHFYASMKQLFKGWHDSRAIMKDPNWRPMPSLK